MQIKYIRRVYLSLLYFTGPLFLLGSHEVHTAELWAAVLAGGLAALVPLWGYGFLLKKLSRDLPLRILAGALALPLSVFSLTAFTEFIHTCVLPHSPVWHIPAALVVMAIWAAFRGQRTTEGFARLIGPAMLLFFLMVILSAMLKIDSGFLTPRIPFDPEIFPVQFRSVWGLYLLQGVVLITMQGTRRAPEHIQGEETESERTNGFQKIALGMILSVILTAVSLLVSVLALSPQVFEALSFPFYYPPGLARDTEYLERMEILWLAILFFAEFARQATLFTAIRKIFKP